MKQRAMKAELGNSLVRKDIECKQDIECFSNKPNSSFDALIIEMHSIQFQ